MSGPAPLIEFFVLEASDLIENIDQIIARGGQSGPDPVSLQRYARGLRGIATMAKLASFANVAAGLERIGRGLNDGAVAWGPGMAGAVVSAIDTLKILLRNSRAWSPADDARAEASAADLARFTPAVANSTPTPSTSSGLTFFAAEATNIAAGLELVVARPDDRDMAEQVLQRARALRGVAGIKDVAGLADILDATDDATRALERGEGSLGNRGAAVLNAAATLLRTIADDLRAARSPNPGAPERAAFVDAVDRWFDDQGEQQPVVPIAELFYPDAGPHLVSAAERPPTSSSERLHLELVSLGEHIKALVQSKERPDESPARTHRALRRTLRTVGSVARSFGNDDVRQLAEQATARLTDPGVTDLGFLMSFADTLVAPSQMGAVADSPSDTATPVVTPSVTAETHPAQEAQPSVETPSAPSGVETPSGADTQPGVETNTGGVETQPIATISLDAGIAALMALSEQPLAPPAVIVETEIVAIDTLLYRGRGALTRAIELRDEIRRGSPGGASPASESLDELFDLLDLALVE